MGYDKHWHLTLLKTTPPLSIFMLFFFKIIQLLLEEKNRYYHQYLDTLHEGQSPLPAMTVQEKYLFLAIIVQMTHNQKDTLEDYQSA
jgi:hypothetical protein